MSETIAVSSSPKKCRRWLRWLAWSTAVLLVLLVAAYFVATSAAFLKSVILPRVSGALNASVTVSDASIHPFSGIVLRDLKVQADGQPPLVTAPEVRVSYHLFDILGGNLHVDEIALVSPTIELVQNPDGSSNLGPILKALQAKPAAEKKPVTTMGASKPLQIDLGKLTLSNATLLQITNAANGRSDVAGLTNVNVTLTNLKNGQTAKLELSADIRVENNSNTNSSGLLAATLKGSFNCSLDANLKPGSAGGSMDLSVSQAVGAFSALDKFSAVLDCDVTPAEIKQLALHFQQAGAPLGELAVAGSFDANKMEGRLAVSLRGIDRRLLNLAGEKSGMDFGSTTIEFTNEIEIAKSGGAITAAGRFDVNKLQLTRAGQTTPTLDFSAAYDLAVDCASQSATLRSLNFTGTQNGAPLLNAQLASPMSLAWGGKSSLGDAELDMAVTGLNLADWKPFLGNVATAGNVGVKLKVSSHQGGKQIGFDLNTDVANLAARIGSNQVSQAEITLEAHGQAAEFKQITLSNYQFQVALQKRSPISTDRLEAADSPDAAAGSSSTWRIRRSRFKSTRSPAASAKTEIPAAALMFPELINLRRSPPI